MKRALKIVGKVMLALLLVVYIAVALCNLSIVQSYLGTAASQHFTREWGGTVRIASLHVSPLGHVRLRGILLVSPTNDTIFDGESIYCHFDHFPVANDGLYLSRVRISNAYYHLRVDSTGINLKYIFDYFRRPDKPKESSGPFVVHVKRLILHNIHYKQDLKRQSLYYARNPYGVNVSHMEFYGIEGNFKDIRVEESNVDCRIVHLETTERSGFHLHDLSADVKVAPYTIAAHNMELTTDHTHMRTDVTLDYDNWDSFSGNKVFDSVHFSVLMNEGTVIGLRDAAYWAPSLYGIDDSVLLSCSVSGPLSRLHIDSLHTAFGNSTSLDIAGDIKGLPHVEHTTFDLDIRNSHIATDDVVVLHQPMKPWFRLPDLVMRLGDIQLEAQLRGALDNGHADLQILSDIGDLSAQAAVAYDGTPRNLRYTLRMRSDQLNLKRLIHSRHISSAGLHCDLEGHGTTLDDLVLRADAAIHDAVVKNHRMNPFNASLRLNKGEYELHGDIDDTLAALQISGQGRLDGVNSSCVGHINLRHGHLTELLGNSDSCKTLILTTTADIDLHGTDINRMRGRVGLTNNHLQWGEADSDIDDITLTLDEENLYKTVRLESAIVQADLAGYLDYTLLPQLGWQFVQRFLPTEGTQPQLSSADSAILATTAFDLDVRWNDPRHRLALLVPSLHIARGTQLHVGYNYTESAQLMARGDSVRYGSLLLRNIAVSGHPLGENFGASCRVDRIDWGKLPLFHNFGVYAASNPASGNLRVGWDDDEHSINDQGSIGLFVQHDTSGLHRVQLTDRTFYIRGRRWDIDCDEVALARKLFQMPRLEVRGETGSIATMASVTPDGNASATATFEHFSIDLVDSLLLADKKLLLEGIVDGQVRAERTAEGSSPYLLADLTIDRCSANDQSLGTVRLQSSLDIERQQMDIAATSTLQHKTGVKQPFVARGYITLAKESAVDMQLHLDHFALATVAPLLSSFANRVDGTVSSDIRISGALSQPVIEGVAHIHDGLLQVDYTGVTYHCNDSVTLTNGHVAVSDFHIYDPSHNLLVANGGIDYSDAANLRIDLTVHSDRIEVLNTKARGSNPYGTLVASVDGTVTGRGTAISIDATAQTRSGSDITIPVDNRLNSAEQEYIHFVSSHGDIEETAVAAPASSTSPSIKLALTITPDLTMRVPVDFNQLEVAVKASGSGDLQLHAGAGRKPSLVGNYEFTSGTLTLSMLSLLEKNFTIESGSSLLFPGDISSIRFDISAVYALRTNLSSLTGSQTETSQRNIPVQSIINLTGDLREPSITFDMRLPNVDATTTEEVFAYIDRSNQRDLLNQTVSLLVMGQFYNSTGENQVKSTTATSGYGVMAQSAGYLMSQLITVVDIDFGYTAATDLTTEQFDIDISKSWDRFYFESTLGYGGEYRNLSDNADAQAMTNLVGDILVGYRLNPRLHLFVFNRTNTNEYTRTELPYKQGLGLKYTRDFNRWGDLFRKSPQP